ncbi:hypothetical protein MRQ36_17290 [Micromonospora sp. R77]|uniref:hypothetical protein n=1 Tax=Micromonospora sp. R77 TaxID=2925836 RepID=UPI001F604B7C|nr:hypothetical protein [Micromonospora sp. R77]MCI4064253.1 hypothetical protein [Micromonospora sp. R77]
MGYRRKDTTPRLALWMLVALGDIVLLLVSAGVSAPAAVIGVVVLTVAAVAGWRLSRRATVAGRGTLPVPVAARRRA